MTNEQALKGEGGLSSGKEKKGDGSREIEREEERNERIERKEKK
jgi:hypothetical protein